MEALSGLMGIIFAIFAFILFVLGIFMPYFVYKISTKTTNILRYLDDILDELKKANDPNKKYAIDAETK